MTDPFPRIIPIRRQGSEALHADGQSLGGTLLDFWQWSASDLVSNATRGRFAEYLVARDLGLATGVRNEWDAYDLETSDGIKIEVKSAAYVQSWHQHRPSSILFRTRKTRSWSADTNQLSVQLRRPADIYIFALLHHTDKATVDPLNVRQWTFYVLPTQVLDTRTRSQHSITLRSLQALCRRSTSYGELEHAIRTAATMSKHRRGY